MGQVYGEGGGVGIGEGLRSMERVVCNIFLHTPLHQEEGVEEDTSEHIIHDKGRKVCFYLTTPREHIDFHIIGYWDVNHRVIVTFLFRRNTPSP